MYGGCQRGEHPKERWCWRPPNYCTILYPSLCVDQRVRSLHARCSRMLLFSILKGDDGVCHASLCLFWTFSNTPRATHVFACSDRVRNRPHNSIVWTVCESITSARPSSILCKFWSVWSQNMMANGDGNMRMWAECMLLKFEFIDGELFRILFCYLAHVQMNHPIISKGNK